MLPSGVASEVYNSLDSSIGYGTANVCNCEDFIAIDDVPLGDQSSRRISVMKTW